MRTQNNSRRSFLKQSFFTTLAIGLSSSFASCGRDKDTTPLLSRIDPAVNYKTFSAQFSTMNDGAFVPINHDGMACFQNSLGQYVLVRNHETYPDESNPSPFPDMAYDPVCNGGTTTIVIDQNLNFVRHFTSLTGTVRNCSGGKTPWNTWLSCEENVAIPGEHELDLNPTKKHGYVFEVNPFSEELKKAQPIKEMGRFKHEACGVHEASGMVYMTEDRDDSCFYRYLPTFPGELHRGGVLQALKIKNLTMFHTGIIPLGTTLDCIWETLDFYDSDSDNVRLHAQVDKGAAIFVRGEGMTVIDDSIFFSCTSGGPEGLGQIFEYEHLDNDNGRLKLVFQNGPTSIFRKPDNLTHNQWGDLIVCEDYSEESRIVGITPEGRRYIIAGSPFSEWAGACFTPDYKVLFVNLQDAGLTYAFEADWESLRASAK